jgi:hypothetical protein
LCIRIYTHIETPPHPSTHAHTYNKHTQQTDNYTHIRTHTHLPILTASSEGGEAHRVLHSEDIHRNPVRAVGERTSKGGSGMLTHRHTHTHTHTLTHTNKQTHKYTHTTSRHARGIPPLQSLGDAEDCCEVAGRLQGLSQHTHP